MYKICLYASVQQGAMFNNRFSENKLELFVTTEENFILLLQMYVWSVICQISVFIYFCNSFVGKKYFLLFFNYYFLKPKTS